MGSENTGLENSKDRSTENNQTKAWEGKCRQKISNNIGDLNKIDKVNQVHIHRTPHPRNIEYILSSSSSMLEYLLKLIICLARKQGSTNTKWLK